MSDPLVTVRAVHFAATLLAAGAVYFDVLILAHDGSKAGTAFRARLALTAWISLALSVASGAVWLLLTARTMSGQPLAALWPQGVIGTVLTQTLFGTVWLVRFGAAILLIAAFTVLFSSARRVPAAGVAALLLATFLVGSLAWAGHAIGASGPEAVLHPAADVLHLIAAAAWLGTLPLLALLLSAARRGKVPLAAAQTATLRFSVLGMASVGVLLVSGLVNTWYLAGSVTALTQTRYGELLLIKVALFLGMVGIAAVNRFRVTPRLLRGDSTEPAAQALRRNALIETLAGVLILIIVAKLGTLPPGNHVTLHAHSGAVPADAAYVHIHAMEGMADVMIVPGRAGRVRATIKLADEDFNLLRAQAVTLSLAPPESKTATLTRAAVADSDDNWRVGDIDLPQPGNWTVTVDITLNADKHLLLDAPIVIEPKE